MVVKWKFIGLIERKLKIFFSERGEESLNHDSLHSVEWSGVVDSSFRFAQFRMTLLIEPSILLHCDLYRFIQLYQSNNLKRTGYGNI